MMTRDDLATFRAALPDCSLAVWSDLRAGTVLAADGDLDYPQENLDALSTCAAQVLSSPGLQASENECPCVLFVSATGLRLFAQAAHTPDVALTCLSSPDADIAVLHAAVQGFLSTASKIGGP